jgi:TonB family protein
MKILRFVFISLFVHLCLTLGLRYVPNSPNTNTSQLTEVEFLQQKQSATKGPPKQVVRNPLVPENLKIQDDNSLARFLSEQKVRVKQEVQATQSGMTKNQTSSTTSNFQSPNNQSNSAQQKTKEDSTDPSNEITNEKEAFNLNESQSNPFKSLNPSSPASTVGEKLPSDIKYGSFTALNTDRYLYYTFYARVEELTRSRWESRIRHALSSFDPTYLESRVRGREWVSEFEFWLDPTGKLHSVHLFKESGVKKFDLAAEGAFREARFFPNPPKDLIQEDGFIRLKYSFSVNF